MTDPITRTQLENAALDATSLSDFVNGSASPGTYETRTGRVGLTLARIEDDVETAAIPVLSGAAQVFWAGGPVSRRANAPTGSEPDGTRSLVGTAGSGAWAGHNNQGALKVSGAWQFYTAQDGQEVVVGTAGNKYTYSAGGWKNATLSGGDTSALTVDVIPQTDCVQDSSIGPGNCYVVTQFGATGSATSHWHKGRGSLSAPAKALSGDSICSFGFRAVRETGLMGGSPAAMFVNLLADSDGTDYPPVTWQWRSTKIGASPEINMVIYEGNLGVGPGNTTPNCLLDVRKDQNAATKSIIRNWSLGSSAQAQMILDTGINTGQIVMYGSAYSGSGGASISRTNGLLVTADGPGGLVLATGAAYSTFIGANNSWFWEVRTNGHLWPAANNATDIGSSSLAVKNIYAVNALNVTSDEWTKEDIRSLNEQEIAAGDAVEWFIFRHKGGDRLHSGAVAQQVEKAFADQGLDPYAYGVLGKDLLFEDKVTEITAEEDVGVMTTIVHKEEVIEIRDGKAVLTFKDVPREVQKTQTMLMFDASGAPVIIPATGEHRTYEMLVTERKPVTRRETTKVPVIDPETGKQREIRFVRYTELKVFCLAAAEARLDKLEAKP